MSGRSCRFRLPIVWFSPANMSMPKSTKSFWDSMWSSGSRGSHTQGVYILVQKQYLFPPPPSENDIFPFFAACCFSALIEPFSSLFCTYFTLLLLISLFFLLFSFSVSFLSFCLAFPPFFLFPFSYFFPQMRWADISPPPGGGGYFPIYRPLPTRPGPPSDCWQTSGLWRVSCDIGWTLLPDAFCRWKSKPRFMLIWTPYVHLLPCNGTS